MLLTIALSFLAIPALAAAAGASVLIRDEPMMRGKGHALGLAFQRSLDDGFADAFLVVDADTVVSPNLLVAFAARLESGALAAQADNAVLNAEDSWRTRLMHLAFVLVNDLRSIARDRMGLSCGLRGNGFCVSRQAVLRVPYDAFSIVEDAEYTLRLAEAAIRVAYAREGRVMSQMVSGERAARSQRRRWEAGRMALARKHGARLLLKGLRDRQWLILDLALDLLVPPLSWVVLYAALGTSIAAAAWTSTGGLVLVPWLTGWAFLLAYVTRGLQLSNAGLRGAAALAWAPVFILWKTLVLAAPRSQRGRVWSRTEREPATPDRTTPTPGAR